MRHEQLRHEFGPYAINQLSTLWPLSIPFLLIFVISVSDSINVLCRIKFLSYSKSTISSCLAKRGDISYSIVQAFLAPRVTPLGRPAAAAAPLLAVVAAVAAPLAAGRVAGAEGAAISFFSLLKTTFINILPKFHEENNLLTIKY